MSSEHLCWFHGKLTREDADELMKQEGDEDGTFLVRESNSALGDYVLTLLFQQEVWHYQIRRHGEDAFFSIDDKIKILHGLDTLVEFYKQAANGLVTQLTKHIKKDPPPNDSRSHGCTNLLHRATKENNQTVVSELLKCGYRNFDAKNQDGQTAVHLAAQYCDEAILKLLLDAGVNVNCMDSNGNMPLHYACRNKSASFIHILIEANANVQGRNINNGHVPLHEAAKYGNLEAIKELLASYAPLLPRTSSGEFPLDLAKEAGHEEIMDFLQSYKMPTPITFQNKWYHGTLNREEAVETLKVFAERLEKRDPIALSSLPIGAKEITGKANTADSPVDISGCFLVRYSERKGAGSGYVLTLLCDQNVKNFIISQTSKYLYIDDGPYLPTLEHLVEHFMRFADGLPVNLKYPVPPKPKPPLPEFSTMPRASHRKSNDTAVTSPIGSPLSPTNPMLNETKNKKIKDDQIRKYSLDAQKSLEVAPSEQVQTLAMPKKKQKENSTSIFNTLRLRSPKKSNDTLRKKTKSESKGASKENDEAEATIPTGSLDISPATDIITNIKFSTDFDSTLVGGGNANPEAPNSNRNFKASPDTIKNPTEMQPDSFYNVPKNNMAVGSENYQGIEEKTEEEVEYFTKSDIKIEEDRTTELLATQPHNLQHFMPNAAGYIPTVDFRVFKDPVHGEFIAEILKTPTAELRPFPPQFPGNRMDSVISTMSNESAVNRYLNRQQSNISTSSMPNSENYFIPSECLELEAVIGGGEFASVYKGRLKRLLSSNDSPKNKNESEMFFECAVKTLRDEHGRSKEFLREAAVMIGLHHHCIVQLWGISKGETLMMVQELMPLGSMLQFILDNRTKINPKYELKLWASQIACGMEYLESKHFVHRDLAARNILLASRHQAKISDFGLSRALGTGNDCYHASQGGKWPIKWYAPESFDNGIFSHASDVWSFGVTLWEMFSLGEPPYGEMRGVEAIRLIKSGERLPQTTLCPDHIYEIMKNCWNYKPKDRPSFRYLTDFFAKDPDYENIREMIKTVHIG